MRILILFFIVLGSVCNAELRTWTAVNGKEVEAEFVSNEKGIVKLKLKSGKVFEVPLDKLSRPDQNFIKNSSLTTSELPDNKNTKSLKLTDKQISKHLGFWIGKWDRFDKSTNQIIDSIELKWKEKGKSLESKGIIFEGGEQKDKFKGSISYDKKLGVFVDVQTFEASGETFIGHSILNLETQSEHGFPIKPESPEDIDIKFIYKKVNQNNVDYTFEVLREGETLEKRESIIKRQGVEPK